MPTQLTVPEGKTYTWEYCLNLQYGKAVQIAKTLKKISRTLIDAIDTARFAKKKLTGPRFKQLVVAAAHHDGWYPAKKTVCSLPKRLPYTTGDPDTRRCIKCSRVLPIADFVREATYKQKVVARQHKVEVEGQELVIGSSAFMRGYTRPERPLKHLSQKCADCWAVRKKPRPDSAQCAILRESIRTETERVWSTVGKFHQHKKGKVNIFPTLSAEQVHAREHYYGLLYALLKAARAELIALKKRKTTRYPDHWHDLLKVDKREELRAAYNRVLWRKNYPNPRQPQPRAYGRGANEFTSND